MGQLFSSLDVSARFCTDPITMLDEATVRLAIVIEQVDEGNKPSSRTLLPINLVTGSGTEVAAAAAAAAAFTC